MAQEVFARLTLRQPISLPSGVESKELVVMRPNARDITTIYDHRPRVMPMLKTFVAACCRAEIGANGSSKLSEFSSIDLDSADASELLNIISNLDDDAEPYVEAIEIGDGITEPIVYNLLYPIKLAAAGKPEEEWETIKQIEFVARKLGDISELLDAKGLQGEYFTFMRLFGTLLGTNMPMADSIIGAVDYLDYFVIRRSIMGKLSISRGRWRRESTVPPFASIGLRVRGTTSR